MIQTLAAALSLLSLLTFWGSALAQATVPCGPFTQDRIASPEPREAAPAVARFDRIKYAVGTEPYRALFLGDSLTERFDAQVWREHMAPRGVLNAGSTATAPNTCCGGSSTATWRDRRPPPSSC